MEGENKDVNTKEILQDLSHDLAMANAEKSGGDPSPLSLVPKPAVKLSAVVVRLAVNSKNRFAINMLSKDLGEDGREVVQQVYATKDEEISAYKEAIELLVQEHCSPEQIEWLNKIAGSPLAILVEIELEKFIRLRRELAVLAKRSKPAPADEGVKLAA